MRRPGPSLTPHRLAVAALAVALCGAVTAAVAETPQIYKWVDANGIAHYTTDPERIPKALRNRVQSLGRPATPAPQAAAPDPGLAEPAGVAEPTAAAEPAEPTAGEAPPAPAIAVPAPATAVSSESWMASDASPRIRGQSSLLAAGHASPEALAALDARIAEVEAEIARDEGVLKSLISDPGLSDDVPLFDRPEFLEISQRLPQLQAKLQELRDERAKLETP